MPKRQMLDSENFRPNTALLYPIGPQKPDRCADEHSKLEPPDPFPNSEVKRLSADGSVAFAM